MRALFTTGNLAERLQNKRSPLRLLSYAMLVIITLLTIIPLVWMVSTGIKTSSELTAFPPTILPREPTLQPLFDAWQTGEWSQWFLNTFIISIGATVVTLAVCTPAAYVLARREFIGKRLLFVTIMAFLIFPAQVLLVPMFLIGVRLGFTNSYHGLIIMYAALYSGFTTFLLWGFFQSLPSDVEDAAKITGIPEWKTFTHIILPLTKPALGVAAIFVFIFAWNEYLWAVVFLNDSSMYTISVGLPVFEGVHGQVAYNELMTMSTLASLPVLILFALTQESFIQGITTGYSFD